MDEALLCDKVAILRNGEIIGPWHTTENIEK